jgi:hypothetical protein
MRNRKVILQTVLLFNKKLYLKMKTRLILLLLIFTSYNSYVYDYYVSALIKVSRDYKETPYVDTKFSRWCSPHTQVLCGRGIVKQLGKDKVPLLTLTKLIIISPDDADAFTTEVLPTLTEQKTNGCLDFK